MQLAYGFTPFEISGAPDWINTSLYNVDAKCDHSVDQQFARFTDDQAKLEKEHMLQALLADRFHLKAHWESKQANVYALELADPKSASKLQPAKVETVDPSIPNAPPPETPGPDIQNHMDAHGHVMTVRYLTTKGMAGLFRRHDPGHRRGQDRLAPAATTSPSTTPTSPPTRTATPPSPPPSRSSSA